MVFEEVELGRMAGVENAEGYKTDTRFVPNQTVQAGVASVSRDEFYKAAAAGKSLAAVFVVWADEYAGETAVRTPEGVFNVERAYRKKLRWFLNCSMISAVQGDSHEV